MRRKIRNLILLFALIVVLVLIPIIIKQDNVTNLISLVLLYTMLGTSWNILGGYAGQTNLGHAVFFGLGALVCRLLWLSGMNIFLSLLIGGGTAVVFALMIGAPAFKLKGVFFSIGMLALAQVANVTVGNVFPDMSTISSENLATYQLMPRYYLFLGLTVLMIGATYLLVHSRIGLGLMAVREEEDAAESLGVSGLKHKLIALAISAFFAGLAGGAYAFYQTAFYPAYAFQPTWTFDSITMVFIGGTGTIIGPIIGAIFFVVLQQFMILKLGEWHVIVFSILFIAVILFLPGGLVEAWSKVSPYFLKKRKKRELKLPIRNIK